MTFPLFPSLTPRISDPSWFLVDSPRNDTPDLDAMEAKLNTWTTSIAQKNFESVTVSRPGGDFRTRLGGEEEEEIDYDTDNSNEVDDEDEEDDEDGDEEEEEEEDIDMADVDVQIGQVDTSIVDDQPPIEININLNRLNITPR